MKTPIYILFLALPFLSCADLKGINKFASSSAETLAKPFPYSYGDYCYDSCYVYDTTAAFVSYPCDYRHAIGHDTAVNRESGKLANYFIALAKLSGSTDIVRLDTLAGAVTAGTYGSLTITPTEASVASTVATAIQDLITVDFKSKHLGSDLRQYGGAVDSSLVAYIRHLDNVANKLRDMHDKLVLRLHIYRERAAATPDRWAILYAYNQKIADLNSRLNQFDALIREIQLARKGYQQMVQNAGDIRSKGLKKNLMALVQNIVYLSKS